MDFESPDVEKDFPGLYASESGRRSESDFSDGGDHEKPSKKDLLGRKKEKKEKKDRGYAALAGESSPEDDTDAKSPSKSKKTKSFKFPSASKSKEKREKSRDKEKVEETVKKELTEKEKKKEKEREKEREREKKEKEKREKLKEKDKEKEEKAKFKLESKEKLKDDKKDKVKDKEKDKVKEKEKDQKVKEKDKDRGDKREKEKVKDKDKDRKEKKLTKVPSTVTSGVPFEEIFTLGVALPIFGVPLQQSVERMRCHDDSGLPLVVRDCIDYLQAHGLESPQLYRCEPDRVRLAQLRRLYAERGAAFPYHWDVPVACALLKAFISELPESILTQELHGQFEQSAAIAEPQRAAALGALAARLPPAQRGLLAWLVRHFESVLHHEQSNHVNMQVLSSAMGPALNMSQNLLTYLVTNAEKLFPDVRLTKYVPPLLTLPADFPETAHEMSEELRKQESLLSQIHAEMHAGFSTPARDHQLWEAQRIVTQLKRKLRAMQKSVETTQPQPQPSADEKTTEDETRGHTKTQTAETTHPEKETKTEERRESPKPQEAVFDAEFEDNFDVEEPVTEPEVVKPAEPIVKPQLSENELKKLRLELENAEYLQLKSLLQAKINSEQFEIVKLRSQIALKNKLEAGNINKDSIEMDPQEEIELKQKLLKENLLLEQKRTALINQIFQERVASVQLKIELAMKELL